MSNSDMALEWFGHSCFSIEVCDTVYYFDPVRVNDMLGTSLSPGKKEAASAIFVSHEHWDHYDADTILALCSSGTKIYCPQPVASLLSCRMTFEAAGLEGLRTLVEKIVPVKKGDTIELEGPVIECLEASEGLSYLIVHEGGKMLFMGDSVATGQMIDEGPDVILFPIWAVKGEGAKMEEFLDLGYED